MRLQHWHRCASTLVFGVAVMTTSAVLAAEPPMFLRFRVQQPGDGPLQATVGGTRKQGPEWYLPNRRVSVTAGEWSEWIDMTNWPLHKRLTRAGGVAEWPSGFIKVRRASDRELVKGCTIDLQISHAPQEPADISATESGGEDTVWFLIPRPLPEKAREFETGSQMAARHLQWAREAVGGSPITLRQFDICTTLWNEPDPILAAQEIQALKLLGFNTVNNAPTAVLREAGVNVLGKTWNYVDDPDDAAARWRRAREKRAERGEDAAWEDAHMRHLVINDEVKTLTLKKVEPGRRDAWFRDYLTAHHVTAEMLGQDPATAAYPYEGLSKDVLARDADLRTRQLLYHGAKFRQWWSARQLRRTSEHIRELIAGMKSETLPTSHGFFCAWGPPHVGMSHALLDFFELGRQHAVDILSVEDWFGLNHMYGPNYTWTGAQSFEYLAAIMRSAMIGRDMSLLSLITPSDDAYLRLKAFSTLGQGAKAFYFWAYGPTYLGTENYWSDLRSEYEGIAKFTRVLQKAEDVLAATQVVSDPVAILYSVSHDLWNTDRTAAFVEKRLLWHALRHLSIQPDFLCEEDVLAGRLEKYRVLFITDHCISRAAGTAIDGWVRSGGTVSLSAGAATRDAFHEPHCPPFAAKVWPDDVAATLQMQEGYRYKERGDLSDAPAMANVSIGAAEEKLPVLGCRSPLRREGLQVWAAFDGGGPAAGVAAHGSGRVVATGFMPMLAYGQLAKFAPRKLEEKWPAVPRDLIRRSLDLAGIRPVAAANQPVVETSLLSGPAGAALVLVNYTYQPIEKLSVDVRLAGKFSRAYSCTLGRELELVASGDGGRLTLPLEWADVVLLGGEKVSK